MSNLRACVRGNLVINHVKHYTMYMYLKWGKIIVTGIPKYLYLSVRFFKTIEISVLYSLQSINKMLLSPLSIFQVGTPSFLKNLKGLRLFYCDAFLVCMGSHVGAANSTLT
jgi:hypothetical protein